jgi:hypothetical protein
MNPEKFTELALQTVQAAQSSAQTQSHSQIPPAHVLLTAQDLVLVESVKPRVELKAHSLLERHPFPSRPTQPVNPLLVLANLFAPDHDRIACRIQRH